MRLTKQTSYAIRILMYCAANRGGLSQIPEIAAAYNLSEPFLFKVLKPLVQHGFVNSVRGRNGGIQLSREAGEIRLSDVVRVTEDNFAMADCFEEEGTNCPLVNNCQFNRALSEALGAFFAALDKYSIEDLAGETDDINALLGLQFFKEHEKEQIEKGPPKRQAL